MTMNKTQFHWTDEMKKHFIDSMLIEVSKGVNSDNGFKSPVWKSILTDFNNKTKLNCSNQQLQSQYHRMKKSYTEFCRLKDNSGFGWDERSHLPTALPSIWASYLDAHPDAKVFQTKTLLFFEDLDVIFSGKVATGQYASSSAISPTDPNHLSNRIKRQIDATDDHITVDPLSIEAHPFKVPKQNVLQHVADSLANLVNKINEEPKEIVDPKKKEILFALEIFKDKFAHSYTVRLQPLSSDNTSNLHFLQASQRYKIKHSISERALFFLELDNEERLFFIEEALALH